MLQLQKSAGLIAIDSGGIPKESFFSKVPCVIFRETTEWTELIDLKWSILCPPSNLSSKEIAKNILETLGNVGIVGNPYGEGTAAVNIVDISTSKGPEV